MTKTNQHMGKFKFLIRKGGSFYTVKGKIKVRGH